MLQPPYSGFAYVIPHQVFSAACCAALLEKQDAGRVVDVFARVKLAVITDIRRRRFGSTVDRKLRIPIVRTLCLQKLAARMKAIDHAAQTLAIDVGVNLRCRDTLMSEKELHGAKVGAAFEEMRCE